jgi:hypothetical protein
MLLPNLASVISPDVYTDNLQVALQPIHARIKWAAYLREI